MMGESFVSLRDVAILRDDCRLTLTAAQRLSRPGKYPYFNRDIPNCTVDDWSFEGIGFALGAAFNVCVDRGTFSVKHLSGRLMISEDYHVFVARDERDLPYIEAILRYTLAKPFTDRNPFVDRLSAEQAQEVRILWPDDFEVRDSLVRLINNYESLMMAASRASRLAEKAVARRFEDLLGVRSHAMRPLGRIAQIKCGRPISETSVAPVAGYPFFTPMGETGRVVDWCVPARSVVFNSQRGRLVARWSEPPSWIPDVMVYLDPESSSVDPAFLLFALGSSSSLRARKGLKMAPVLSPVAVADVLVPCFGEREMEDFSAIAGLAMRRRYYVERLISRYSLIYDMLLKPIANGSYPASKIAIAMDSIEKDSL